MLLPGTIGSFTFIEFRGAPDLAKQLLEVITRPGVDGVAYKKIAVQPPPFTVQTTAGVTSDAALVQLREDYLAAIGAVVDVIEPGLTASQKLENIIIENVTPGQIKRVANATDNIIWLLRATWTLRSVAVP